MSAPVLLNLLNESGKRDKMRGLPSILSLFSVNSILFKYKYIMIQKIYIHKTLHLKGVQK